MECIAAQLYKEGMVVGFNHDTMIYTTMLDALNARYIYKDCVVLAVGGWFEDLAIRLTYRASRLNSIFCTV